MANTLITKKDLLVPTDAMIEVADVLIEHDINNTIVGTDEENGRLVIEVQYEKEQRDIIHHVEDLIADFEDDEDDDDDDEEDDE